MRFEIWLVSRDNGFFVSRAGPLARVCRITNEEEVGPDLQSALHNGCLVRKGAPKGADYLGEFVRSTTL